jgi:hypothetical protein
LPDYLPLCAFRQGLLPLACRSCAWWQTTVGRPDGDQAAEVRARWLPAVEQQWGSAGLLFYEDSARPADHREGGLVARASLHFAPVESVPRFRTLGFGPLPEGAALLFCLHHEGRGGRLLLRRLILRALRELRRKGVKEVYAVAGASTETADARDCRFFAGSLLALCGFEHVASSGPLDLMRADLRGLVHLIAQTQAALRRLLHNQPTPSPAAWSRPGAPPP